MDSTIDYSFVQYIFIESYWVLGIIEKIEQQIRWIQSLASGSFPCWFRNLCFSKLPQNYLNLNTENQLLKNQPTVLLALSHLFSNSFAHIYLKKNHIYTQYIHLHFCIFLCYLTCLIISLTTYKDVMSVILYLHFKINHNFIDLNVTSEI